MQVERARYQENNKDLTFQTFAIFSMAIAFFYTMLRAYLLPITLDEAISYLNFVRSGKSFFDVLTYAIPSANNHLLNSLLIRISTYFFGNSEFAIRLPSLMGHLLFLAGIYKILNLFLQKFYLIVGIWLLTFQPFLLEYFSLGRGYALALGFMSFGLYFLFLVIKTENDSMRLLWSALSLFMLSLSGLSHLIFLNLWVAFALIILCLEVFRRKEFFNKMKGLRSILFAGILPNILLLWLIYANLIVKLQARKEFYVGGRESFWKDTIISLITNWLYHINYFPNACYLVLLIVISILAIACFVIYLSIRRKQVTQITAFLIVILAILILSSLAIWMEHILLNAAMPYSRMVIFFIPFFLILTLLLCAKLHEPAPTPMKKIFHTGVLTVILLFISHSLRGFNLTRFEVNNTNLHTKDVITTIAKLTENKNFPDASVKIGVSRGHNSVVNYYLIENNLKQFRLVYRNGFDGPFDFYYVREEDKGIIEKLNLKILKHYDVYPAYLAVPQNSPFLDIEGSTS